MNYNDLILSVLAGAILLIGYFLGSIHIDHKKSIINQTTMRIESLRMQGDIDLIKQKTDSDNKLWEERISHITRIFEKQTTIIEDLQKNIIHLDKNTMGIKLFFEKYEKVEDKQIDLEKRVAHLETIHETKSS